LKQEDGDYLYKWQRIWRMARWKERMHNVQSMYVNDISNPNKAKE